MNQPAISAHQLTKIFYPRLGFFRRGEPKVAVDAVDLEIRSGEIFVLLGKNGAGKTSLVKILSTLLLPTSGSAEVYGCDIDRDEARVRRLIGFATTDERSFYWRLSGRQNLRFFAALHGIHGRAQQDRIEQLSHDLELGDFLDRRFDGYSSGMKQRMSLARSLLGNPRLLFLDEPTRSLDPAAQRQTCDLVDSLRGRLTVVLVTHQLEEARTLGDRIGFMESGKLRVFERDEVDLQTLF